MKNPNFVFVVKNKLLIISLKIAVIVLAININIMPSFAIQENEKLELVMQENATTLNNDSTISGEISFQPENSEVIRRHISLPPRYFIGARLGFTSGSGVSFGMDRIIDKFSAEGTLFLLKSNNFSVYSVGGSLKYALIDEEKRHLYLNYGLSYNYWSVNKNDNKLSSPFRTGLGLGYMQFFSNNFAYDLSILATYFTGDATIYPVPQVSIQYHFKD